MNLTISWRAIGIASTCLAIALAAALGVVVARTDADYLSTLALALASIAFVVQIIVFIAQTAASSQQLARAEELHGATTRTLAAIEEKAEGTRTTVNTLNERMLEAVIGKVLPEAAAATVTQRVAELLQGSVSADSESQPGLLLPYRPEQRRTRRPMIDGTLPEQPELNKRNAPLPPPAQDRMHTVAQVLGPLEARALADLDRLGADYERFGNSPRGRMGHGVRFVDSGPELRERGLVKRISAPWESGPVYVLSDLGREAAGLLRAETLPYDAPPEVVEYRKRVIAERARAQESMRQFYAAEDQLPLDDVS